jgi:hypothetical protein
MAENLQEQLAQRIKQGEKVTAFEAADAFDRMKENRRKEYRDQHGGSDEAFEQDEKDFLEAAKALLKSQLDEIEAAGAARGKKEQLIASVNAELRRSFIGGGPSAGPAGRQGTILSETAPPVQQNPETREAGGLDFLGKVNSEYRDALERILRDSEKPGGALFDLPFNKTVLPCRLTKNDRNQYFINWEGGMTVQPYPTLQNAMEAINSGLLLRGITSDMLSSEASYKPYENSIDGFKEKVQPSGRPFEVYFELDWKGGGQGEGNPRVWAMAYPYGGISYRIERDHAAIDGGNVREGFAANFDDLMKQLGTIKTWSENYEDNRDHGRLDQAAMNRETMFAQVADPRLYYAAENGIGRPVDFGILNNTGARVFLDWGGGAAKDGLNAKLDVTVDFGGGLNFDLDCPARGLSQHGTAPDLQALLLYVGNLRAEVLGKDVLNPRQIASMAHGLYDSPEAGPAAASELLQTSPAETVEAFLKQKGLREGDEGGAIVYSIKNLEFLNNPEVMECYKKLPVYMNNMFNKNAELINKTVAGFKPQDTALLKDFVQAAASDKKSPEGDSPAAQFIKSHPEAVRTFEGMFKQILDNLPPQYKKGLEQLLDIIGSTMVETKLVFPARPGVNELRSAYEQRITPRWKEAGGRIDAIIAQTA